MTSAPVPITLAPGYRGFVAAVVNADYKQRLFLDVRDTQGNQLTSATFEAQGVRVPMKNVFTNADSWSFGPFDFNATVNVKITHARSGSDFNDSKMVGPLTILKAPEPDYPMEFRSSTVISEDLADASHDDCTVVVLQYK